MEKYRLTESDVATIKAALEITAGLEPADDRSAAAQSLLRQVEGVTVDRITVRYSY